MKLFVWLLPIGKKFIVYTTVNYLFDDTLFIKCVGKYKIEKEKKIYYMYHCEKQ